MRPSRRNVDKTACPSIEALAASIERVGLLQWKRFDRIVQRGYEHGLAVLTERAAQHPEVG